LSGLILGVCLIATEPPCITSTSVEALKRNLIKSSETGSTVRPVGFEGRAVLPTVTAVREADVALGIPVTL